MKILLICSHWAKFEQPLMAEMHRQGHQVVHLQQSDLSNFKYMNRWHRLLSKLYYILTWEKYKEKIIDLMIDHSLSLFFKSNPQFDLVIMMEPARFNPTHLKIFKAHCRKVIAYIWDSVFLAPKNIRHLKCFDKVYSFDENDCKKFGMTQDFNFIDPSWHTNIPMAQAEYDVFCIMSFTKERYQMMVDFLNANPNLNSRMVLYISHPRKRKYIRDSRIHVIEEVIVGETLKQEIEHAKCILDIARSHQAGFSFRIFESIGYQRKLITTNPCLAHHELYSEHNIHIIRDHYQIDPDFLSTPYQPLPKHVTERYTIAAWVQRITRGSLSEKD